MRVTSISYALRCGEFVAVVSGHSVLVPLDGCDAGGAAFGEGDGGGGTGAATLMVIGGTTPANGHLTKVRCLR